MKLYCSKLVIDLKSKQRRGDLLDPYGQAPDRQGRSSSYSRGGRYTPRSGSRSYRSNSNYSQKRAKSPYKLREIALGEMISAIFAARKAIGPETVGVRVKTPTPNHPIRVDNEVGQTLEIPVDLTAVALVRQSTPENLNPLNHPLQERKWNSGVLEGGFPGSPILLTEGDLHMEGDLLSHNMAKGSPFQKIWPENA